MEEATLNITIRNEIGKGPARRLRQKGLVPGVMYGGGKNYNVTVDPKPMSRNLVTRGGRNRVYSLKGEGMEGKHAIVRDYQVDPVRRNLKHVDLQEIDVSKKVYVTIPLNVTGKSAGVVEGGVLNVVMRELDIECLPNQIPENVEVDVTALNIGDSIHVDDLKLPEGVKKGIAQNPAIVTVVPPAKEEELAPSLTSAEPEVITEKKDDKAAAGGDAKKEDDKKKDGK